MRRTVKLMSMTMMLGLMWLLASTGPMQAAEKEVTIGFQQVFSPWKVAIVDGALEKATGYKINWREFKAGPEAINALASGSVDITDAGSPIFAAGMSKGLDMELFWIIDDIASAEALAVRNGSGIKAPQDLKGKKIAVPYGSTTHFHLMFALEQFNIDPKDVKILNMKPPAIIAAWDRGDIDAAFIWDPVLGHLKKGGHVMLSSGQLCVWGKCTFDGLVANSTWASAHPDFMTKFAKVLDDANEAYRKNPAAWTPTSEPIKKIVKLIGSDGENAVKVLALYGFPNLQEMASDKWLGGGKDGGAARALYFTAQFMKEQGKIPKVLDDYSKYVNPEWAKRAQEK